MKIFRRDFVKSGIALCTMPLVGRIPSLSSPRMEWHWSKRSISGFHSMEGHLAKPVPRSLLAMVFPKKEDPQGSIMLAVNSTEFLGCPPESLCLEQFHGREIDEGKSSEGLCYSLARLRAWQIVHTLPCCDKVMYGRNLWKNRLPSIKKEHRNAGKLVDFNQLFAESIKDDFPRHTEPAWQEYRGDLDPQIQGQGEDGWSSLCTDQNGRVVKEVMNFRGLGKCTNCDYNRPQPVVFSAMMGTHRMYTKDGKTMWGIQSPVELSRPIKTRVLCRKCGHYLIGHLAIECICGLDGIHIEYPWNVC